MIGPLVGENRREAQAARGWFAAHKWWLLRRASQFTALALFMAGPWLGWWLVRGNFASSEIGGVLRLSDPFILTQSAFAGWTLAAPALIGGLVIIAFYLFVGGRAYCGWICPVNVVTDSAQWVREKTGLNRDRKISRRTRLYLLAGVMLASAITSTMAWEFINPVTLLQRALISGIGIGWVIVAAVFLLDLFIARRAWCSHLCPMGAFYGLVGRFSFTRVAAARREACTDCGACFNICPEPHVIMPALKGQGSRLIRSGDCLNCGACIDSCHVSVFEMSTRLADRSYPLQRLPGGAEARSPAGPARTTTASAVAPRTAASAASSTAASAASPAGKRRPAKPTVQ